MFFLKYGDREQAAAAAVSCFVFFSHAAVFLCGFRRGEDTGEQKEEAVVPVKAVRAAARDIARTLEYVGDVRGRDEAVVYPKVSGKVIEKAREEGARVLKGNPIVFVDRDETGYQFEKAPVESSLDGTVGRIFVDLGSYITPQTPVALVVDTEDVKIVVDIPESRLPEISVGKIAHASVDAYPGEAFSGVVAKISPVLDPATRSAPAEVVVSNKEGRLKSGMYARVEILLEEYKKILLIPQEAVIGRSEHAWVYIIEGDKAFRREIVTGFKDEPFVSVKEGLREGDLVVVVGHQKLHEGARVAVELMEPQGA